MPAILTESPAEILRVRLLSSAQHKQAPATASAGQEVAISPGRQPRITPPQTIRDIPSIRRRSKFSRNTNQARRAVNTLSRFKSSDTDEAELAASASIRSTGPITPPEITAPASHLQSPGANRGRSSGRQSKP